MFKLVFPQNWELRNETCSLHSNQVTASKSTKPKTGSTVTVLRGQKKNAAGGQIIVHEVLIKSISKTA